MTRFKQRLIKRGFVACRTLGASAALYSCVGSEPPFEFPGDGDGDGDGEYTSDGDGDGDVSSSGGAQSGGATSASGGADGGSADTSNDGGSYGGGGTGPDLNLTPADCGPPGYGGALSADPERLLETQAGGLILPEENSFSIDGVYYSYADSFTSFQPEAYDEIPAGPVCLTGSFPGVIDGNYDTMYGAGVGLILDFDHTTKEPTPYDATAHGVTGFSFVVSGDQIPRLRFNVKMTGVPDNTVYCTPENIEAGYNEVRFDEAFESCWNGYGGAFIDPTQVTEIQWVTPTGPDGFDYCYCIEQLQVLTD